MLNDQNEIASDACELYQCHAIRNVCELSARDDDRDGWVAAECAAVPLAAGLDVDCNDEVPSGTEVCNGRDDDCDGVIDERYSVEDVATNALPDPNTPTMMFFTAGFSDNGLSGYGTGSGLAVTHSTGTTTIFGLVDGSGAIGPITMTSRRAANLDSITDPDLVAGCDQIEPGVGIGFQSGMCAFAEVGVGLTTANVFVAGLTTERCTLGQLRVGYFERTQATGAGVVQRGPLARSNAFFGIDVTTTDPDPSLRCTGASRASGIRGAARTTVAAMDLGVNDQALAAWIADPISRGPCGGGDPRDVEVLGLHVQRHDLATPYGWVTASNEGAQQAVGSTTQGGPPAVAAWSDRGYLVGFGAPVSGINLVFVGQMARPPAFDPGHAVETRDGLETPPLTITPLLSIPTAGQVSDVAIAFGSIRAGGIDVGLTWREGCGTASQTLLFKQIFLAHDGANASVQESQSFAAIALTAAPSSELGAPVILYAFDGMLEPGIARVPAERPSGTSQNDGGWIVAWADGSERDPGPVADDTRILARRISEADGSLLNDEETLLLSPADDVRRIRPVLYVGDGDRIHYAYQSVGSGSALRGGPLSCVRSE